MFLEQSSRSREFEKQVSDFMTCYVYPNEAVYRKQHAELADRWDSPSIVEELKSKARAQGLWNLFLPESTDGAGLTNLEYAPLCAIMGRSYNLGTEVFNCSAPDTGNMEVLERYGTDAQKEAWLETTPCRYDSFCFCDVGTGCSLLGCHQHQPGH